MVRWIGNDIANDPFPKGRRPVELRIREAVWAQGDPHYAEPHVKPVSVALEHGTYWHLCWNFFLTHGYIGYKPIDPRTDPKFVWRAFASVQALMGRDTQFVQRSARSGWGKRRKQT